MLVLGFVFGAMLLEAIGGYVMMLYPVAVANVQMDSTTGFFSIIGFTALFFFVMAGLITSCFSVTYILPDAIFAFIGAHNSATAQVGRDTERNAETGVKVGTGGAWDAGGRSMSRMAQTIGQNKMNNKQSGKPNHSLLDTFKNKGGGGDVGPGKTKN
jgi:UPF0716 family protein affecting phage T7 exclusion